MMLKFLMNFIKFIFFAAPHSVWKTAKALAVPISIPSWLKSNSGNESIYQSSACQMNCKWFQILSPCMMNIFIKYVSSHTVLYHPFISLFIFLSSSWSLLWLSFASRPARSNWDKYHSKSFCWPQFIWGNSNCHGGIRCFVWKANEFHPQNHGTISLTHQGSNVR